MITTTTTVMEQDRVVKRLKVDSPSGSLEYSDDSNDSPPHDELVGAAPTKQRTTAVHDHTPFTAKWAGSPPSDGTDGITTANASRSRDNSDGDDGDAAPSGANAAAAAIDDAVVASSAPGLPSGSDAWRAARHSLSSATVPSVSAISASALPVSTHGAITTLHSLGQLHTLVSNPLTAAARDRVHPSLRLKPGETVMLLLHFDETSLHSLMNDATSNLSQMRVFTVNLAKLPPQDYEAATPERRLSGGFSSPDGSARVPPAGGATPPHTSAAAVAVEEDEEEEDEDEEEELVPVAHRFIPTPQPTSATAVAVAVAGGAGTQVVAGKSCLPRASAAVSGALAMDDTASVSSLSNELHHASNVISEKLRQMLAVDSILNPHASQHRSHADGSSSSSMSKKEALLFPAMIVWRAAGAAREEYPPAPPQTYSSQPTPTQPELFCDRLAAHGGPLVVKEATSVDQVHSLTLFRPVYTMEHLFRTLVRTIAPTYVAKGPGEKSRTVLYLGASWCPPCMRFVHEMPQLIREGLPSSVTCTLKADMDLAKPIYDFLKVEVIPTFLVLDNDVLMQCYERTQQQQTATGGASQSDYTRAVLDAFGRAELGRLQNSNRQLVSTFISKHSQPLSFDEDF